MDDRTILDALRNREQEGLTALERSYGPLMRYIISPILKDPREREECLEDVVLLVWEKAAHFDPEKGKFSTWLTAVTRNSALNRRRSLERRGPESPLEETLPDPAPTPEEALLRKERAERLRAAVLRLSEKDRMLFYRKYYYLQSTAQMAAESGLTERAVEGRLRRIRKHLQQELGGEFHD